MIFKVKVDDFWLDDENLSEGLQRAITKDVLAQIKDDVTKRFNELLVEYMEREVEKVIPPLVASLVDGFTENSMVTPKAGGYPPQKGDPISIKDYLNDIFRSSTGFNAKTEIQKYAKQFGETLKHQYNAAFANQIVANLKEQGMLKDEVVNALLTGPKEAK